jgi:hypothetical protein
MYLLCLSGLCAIIRVCDFALYLCTLHLPISARCTSPSSPMYDSAADNQLNEKTMQLVKQNDFVQNYIFENLFLKFLPLLQQLNNLVFDKLKNHLMVNKILLKEFQFVE